MSRPDAGAILTRDERKRAEVLQELGRYDEALAILTQLLAVSPEDDDLHCQLAAVYLQKNDLAACQKHAGSALGLNPNSAWAHALLSQAHYARRALYPGLEQAREAVRLEPDEVGNWYLLAWGEYHLHRMKAALEAAEKGLALDTEHNRLHRLAGDIHMKRHRYRQAASHYESALRIDPDDAASHFDMGFLANWMNRPKQALDHLLNAVRLAPFNQAYRRTLGDHVCNMLEHLTGAQRARRLAELPEVARAVYEDEVRRRKFRFFWRHPVVRGVLGLLIILLVFALKFGLLLIF